MRKDFFGGILAAAASLAIQAVVAAQEPPRIRAAALPVSLHIDGNLDEAAWQNAEAIDQFTQSGPDEGQPATARTTVRVVANATSLAIGIVCTDPDPARIVSFSVRRDAALDRRRSRAHRPRSVPRRPIRIRVRRQPERRALRRADQAWRRGRQRRVGRHLGGGHAADRDGLER